MSLLQRFTRFKISLKFSHNIEEEVFRSEENILEQSPFLGTKIILHVEIILYLNVIHISLMVRGITLSHGLSNLTLT